MPVTFVKHRKHGKCRIRPQREIARVARKEVRRETAALKKASAAYRSEIAALKRRASSGAPAPAGRQGRGAQRTGGGERGRGRAGARSVPRAWPRSVAGSACRPRNAGFWWGPRHNRSTTGRKARRARVPSICRPSSRCAIWVDAKQTRSLRHARRRSHRIGVSPRAAPGRCERHRVSCPRRRGRGRSGCLRCARHRPDRPLRPRSGRDR